jgi:hypothetical protein
LTDAKSGTSSPRLVHSRIALEHIKLRLPRYSDFDQVDCDSAFDGAQLPRASKHRWVVIPLNTILPSYNPRLKTQTGPRLVPVRRVLMSQTTTRPSYIIEFDNELQNEPRFPVFMDSDARVGVGIEPVTVSIVIALIALCITTTGAALGVINFINGKASAAGLADKLDALQRGQKDILNELDRLRGEVEWAQILLFVAQPIQRIKYFFDEMRRLVPPSNFDPPQIEAWRKKKEPELKEWAKGVLVLDNGMRQQLSYINTAFHGGEGLTKPLVESLIDKVKLNGFKTQSAYYMVCVAYRSIKTYEANALAMLAAAYKVEHPGATDQQAEDYVKPYQDVFEKQIEETLPVLVALNRFWTRSYMAVGGDAPIKWTQWKIVYGDQSQVTTEDGCVLVGLQIYKNGNRVALEITQAALDNAGDINASSEKKITKDWSASYYQIGANTEIQLMTTVVPNQCMATGVQLCQDGNKLMVLLQYVPFDFTKLTADFSKRAWTKAADATTSPNNVRWYSSDPDGNVASDSDRGRVGTTYDVTPDPLSPITGVMLDLNGGTGSNNYMLARIKTDFYGPDKPTKKSV